VLPVVESRSRPDAKRPGPAPNGRPATPVMGVPVRVQTEPAREAAAARPATDYVATPEGDFWHATVQALATSEAITALVRELALQSQLVGRDTDHWLLRVERESLNQPAARERLQQAYLHHSPDVVVFGHTHQVFHELLDGRLYLNPGYSGRRKGDERRSVAVLRLEEEGLEIDVIDL
jgi:hypothetical protein